MLLEILKTPSDRKYWFLYEGTPGGKFDPQNYYYGSNHGGPFRNTPDFHKEKAIFEPLQWAYVGRVNHEQTFFMLHLDMPPETGILSYLGNSESGVESEDGMTVFGFGRGPNTQPLFKGKQSFAFGLLPTKIETEKQHTDFETTLLKTFKFKN